MTDTIGDASLPLAGKRGLVLEDEFLIAIDIESVLSSAGAAKVVCASNTAQALSALATDNFDFAVLDLKLANVTSHDVADALRKKSVPFLFVTGAPTDAMTMARFPHAPILGKPFATQTLLEMIVALLAAR